MPGTLFSNDWKTDGPAALWIARRARRDRKISDTKFKVRFDEPQFALTPGQAAVVYDGDEVLGGGWIK